LIVLLAAAYGLLALAGPALHGLLSCGHPRVAVASDESLKIGSRDAARSTILSPAHCAICHFLAQGQMPATGAHFDWQPQRASFTPSVPPSIRIEAAFTLPGSRAPPSLFINLS
jgi:cytochrome c5